jgi:signal transduction histidine kinase
VSAGSTRFGLKAKLLTLLLAFGVFPVAASALGGYLVSRGTIITQAEQALVEVTAQQATHLATELARERLLLRTIAGQLPMAPGRLSADRLGELLVQALPENGVFDGLRVVTSQRTISAQVALRNTEPHWPAEVPASDWRNTAIAVHREGDVVLAYMIAVPLGDPDTGPWLEGHVRSADFPRVFAIPEHLMGGVELAVMDRKGGVLAVGHRHATELGAVPPPTLRGRTRLTRGEVGDQRALIATSGVEETDWTVATALPLHLALAPLARLRDTAVLGTLGLIVAIVLTGVFTSGTVTTALEDLGAAARRYGADGVYRPVLRRSSDEVGELVDAFNRMAEQVERSRAEVERLHAEQLERAQQLATVGELASGVAHEIRNPLTGVRGALELALGKLGAEDSSRPLLEEARRQLGRIETTTTQLLRYARPPELRRIVVDAGLLVERALRVVEPQAHGADVGLELEPAPAPAPVEVDPELVVQVLVNLLLNAIDASSPSGHVVVWLSPHPPDIWIGVRDTGPGVPPEHRSTIFRPFYTTKHQGTGLGLSISQQIAARHGGAIRVEDTPGGGATFIVSLPLKREGDARDQV